MAQKTRVNKGTGLIRYYKCISSNQAMNQTKCRRGCLQGELTARCLGILKPTLDNVEGESWEELVTTEIGHGAYSLRWLVWVWCSDLLPPYFCLIMYEILYCFTVFDCFIKRVCNTIIHQDTVCVLNYHYYLSSWVCCWKNYVFVFIAKNWQRFIGDIIQWMPTHYSKSEVITFWL